jgi:hypothetical protein
MKRIDYERMKPIRAKQIKFKSSEVQKKSIARCFQCIQCINKRSTEKGNHAIYESDTKPSCVDTVKQISQVDGAFEANHVSKMADSTDVKHVFQTGHADKTNDKPQIDSVLEPLHTSKSGFANEMNNMLARVDIDKTNRANDANESHKYGKISSMTIKSPFSTFVEIDDFLHPPVFGSPIRHTAEFLDLNNRQTPQLDTKLFHMTTYYPEQPHCYLVSSQIHEMIFFTDTVRTYGMNNKKNHYKSNVVPVHDSLFTKTKETNNQSCTSHNFIKIRAPVVVGEYEIEICLEENVVFEEEIMKINEISKEVVLTNCKFIPTQFSPSLGNGTYTALKGNLFIEGYIQQNIEYTAVYNRNTDSIQKDPVTHLHQLCQKIVLDLIIHLLQVQQVRVNYDSKGV